MAKDVLRFWVASTNAGKLRDFEYALVTEAAERVELNLAPLPGLETIEAPEETASSFAGNARLKAIYYSRFAPGKLVLADDSVWRWTRWMAVRGCGRRGLPRTATLCRTPG